MVTLDKKLEIMTMQYILEKFVELYDDCKKESDKYYLKKEFLQYIHEEDSINIVDILSYMRLQEDKFKPFINCLQNVELSSHKKSSKSINSRVKDGDSILAMILQ